MPERTIRFELPIHAWAARAGDLKSESDWRAWLDDPRELPATITTERVAGTNPMQLRRLGRLGNAAVAIGKTLLEEVPSDRSLSVVTVSELGELETNDALIESIVAGAPVSPQRFAASVHNHVLGQLCINLGLPCRGGASTGGLEVGLIEALGEMHTDRWVLALVFEPRVETHYAPWCGGTWPEHMVGVLLQPEADTRLVLERRSGSTQPGAVPKPRALHWLALLTGQAKELAGEDEGWCWSHVDS